MFEIGIEKKGNNVIASAIHLPTNTLIRRSSQSEEKALAKCIMDINLAIKSMDWLVTKDNGKYVDKVIFSGFASFNTPGLSQIDFELAIDRALKIMPSIHRFDYSGEIYTAFTFERGHDVYKLFFTLFNIEGAEFAPC